MGTSKDFWAKWEWDAWRNDPKLRRCLPSTRGIWIDVICLMMNEGVYKITDTVDGFACTTGNTPDAINEAIGDLELRGACDVLRNSNGSVTLVSRRRQREASEREYNKLRKRRLRCPEDVPEMSPSSSVSPPDPEGSPEGGNPPPHGKTVATMVRMALEAYNLNPDTPDAMRVVQTVRSNCFELCASGVTVERLRKVIDWIRSGKAKFAPQSPRALTDPEKFPQWESAMNGQDKGRRPF